MMISKEEAERILRSQDYTDEEKVEILENGEWKLIEILDFVLNMEEK